MKFNEWLKKRELEEGRLSNWAAPAILGAASFFGGNNTVTGQIPVQQSQQQQEVKKISNNTYEVVGVGRTSKIGGPNYAYQQASRDALVKLYKHLGVNTANVRQEVVNTQTTPTGVNVTYRIVVNP